MRRPGGVRGQPRGRTWTTGELALLDRILDRAVDGRDYARKRELVELAERTGRTISACATRLYLRRRGDVWRTGRRQWTPDELARVDAILDRGGARRGFGEVAALAAALGRSRNAVEIQLVKRRKLRTVPTGGATPAGGDGGSTDAEVYNTGAR